MLNLSIAIIVCPLLSRAPCSWYPGGWRVRPGLSRGAEGGGLPYAQSPYVLRLSLLRLLDSKFLGVP